MAISYKKLFNLLEANGWTTYKIRNEKLIGQGTLTALKNGTGGLDSKTISRICAQLKCQPGDLMEYTPFDIVRHTPTQLMVNNQQLADAIKCINHEEHFYSLCAKSSLRNFLEDVKEAFSKDIPVVFYSYIPPGAMTPAEQESYFIMSLKNPNDLWKKWGNRRRDEINQKFIREIFNQVFPECESIEQ